MLIPPGGSHTSTWRFNIDALSRSHQVWTFDLPGSGYSDKPAAFPYTHKSYAEFVRDFMTVMGIPKAVLVGQSLGGTVALEFALDFPEKTAGIVLIDSGGYPRGVRLGPLNPLRHRMMNAILMSFSSYPAVVRAFFSQILPPSWALLARLERSLRRFAISIALQTPGARSFGCNRPCVSISRSRT